MIGIPDVWISLAYVLAVGSTLACVVYGLVNWNKGADNESAEIKEETSWEKKESEIEDNM